MSRDSIKSAFGPPNTVITKDRAEQILAGAGKISKGEEAEMKAQVKTHKLDAEAAALFQNVFDQLPTLRAQAEREDSWIAPQRKTLMAETQAMLTPGKATKSYGGTPIPEAVKTLVNQALKDGCICYDVRELDTAPFYNYNDRDLGPNGLQTTGKYSPYAQEQDAVGPLAFDYTEITPAKLAAEADPKNIQTFKALDTSKGNGGFTEAGGKGQAILKDVTGPGSARIANRYDIASWPDPMARGEGNMKWAGNFAILSDGSVHCVPASRRPEDDSQILTTASLGRGKLELFNGHIFTDDTGTVTYVGKSGRLQDFKTIDAVALLKAAGFKVAPGLTVTQE